MATTKLLPVKQLRLDVRNFRTVPQSSELKALHTMISINPERFWALMESLLDTGYLPTENIIVLQDKKGVIHVKEGNRRIGSLKLIFKYLSRSGLSIPPEIADKLKAVTDEWKAENESVPCAVYGEHEETVVDKIVTLAHGKGQQAGRDNWTSVARARHNREKNGVTEIGLDLLEKYLKHGKNLTDFDKERWSGVFPITVVDELLGKIAPRFGYASSRQLVNQYPKKHRKELEEILNDVGYERLKFNDIRDKKVDFGAKYGIRAPAAASATASPSPGTATGSTSASSATPTATSGSSAGTTGVKALAANDPKGVARALRTFSPRGAGRDKLVLLVGEAKGLNLKKHPHAFCFLLRAMFEISAKAYCADHATAGLSYTKPDGTEKKLVTVLNEIVKYMTKGKPKTDPLVKDLHGANTELTKPTGLLSVTSMNQLIHNPKFVVDETHICTVFANIFPLLQEMNR